MLLVAIVLFSVAALLGVYLVYIGLRHHRGSLSLGLGHAFAAISALVLLIVQIYRDSVSHKLYNSAAVLFILTAAGGIMLLALREGRKPPPMLIVAIHAAFALLALSLLILGFLHS